MVHVHSKLIKAWADGAKIQFYCEGFGTWEDILEPSWCRDTKYRIKPCRTKFKVALFKSLVTGGVMASTHFHYFNKVEKASTFICWVHEGYTEDYV